MKLAGLILVALLGGTAHADHSPMPVDPYGPPLAQGPRDPFADPARAQHHQRKQALRQLLVQHFDRNGDGRLGPREREHAAKALHRLALRMSGHHKRHRMQGMPGMQGMQRKQGKRQKLIRRFDRNHDGHVGPGELPPAIADELRPLDDDGDGWLESDELP
jgi:hypothetical protein